MKIVHVAVECACQAQRGRVGSGIRFAAFRHRRYLPGDAGGFRKKGSGSLFSGWLMA